MLNRTQQKYKKKTLRTLVRFVFETLPVWIISTMTLNNLKIKQAYMIVMSGCTIVGFKMSTPWPIALPSYLFSNLPCNAHCWLAGSCDSRFWLSKHAIWDFWLFTKKNCHRGTSTFCQNVTTWEWECF